MSDYFDGVKIGQIWEPVAGDILQHRIKIQEVHGNDDYAMCYVRAVLLGRDEEPISVGITISLPTLREKYRLVKPTPALVSDFVRVGQVWAKNIEDPAVVPLRYRVVSISDFFAHVQVLQHNGLRWEGKHNTSISLTSLLHGSYRLVSDPDAQAEANKIALEKKLAEAKQEVFDAIAKEQARIRRRVQAEIDLEILAETRKARVNTPIDCGQFWQDNQEPAVGANRGKRTVQIIEIFNGTRDHSRMFAKVRVTTPGYNPRSGNFYFVGERYNISFDELCARYKRVSEPALQQGQCGEQKAPVEAPFFVWLAINHKQWRNLSLITLSQFLAAYQAGQASKR